jgi:hypothetical protein
VILLAATAALLFNGAAVRVTGRFIDTLNRAFTGKTQTACRYLQKFIPLMVCTLAVLEAAL